jgi:hypothetical protein
VLDYIDAALGVDGAWSTRIEVAHHDYRVGDRGKKWS